MPVYQAPRSLDGAVRKHRSITGFGHAISFVPLGPCCIEVEHIALCCDLALRYARISADAVTVAP